MAHARSFALASFMGLALGCSTGGADPLVGDNSTTGSGSQEMQTSSPGESTTDTADASDTLTMSDSGVAEDGTDSSDDIDALNEELFDQKNLPQFDIILDSAAIEALNADPKTYVKATFRYGEETVENVGVKLKGSSSFRDLSKKAAFKIKFDAFTDGQSFRGLRRLTLNNMLDDWSMISERIAFEVFRACDYPAPRANHAEVYVNDAYYGLYANIESEDKTFLRRWFASDDGNLYERQNGDDSIAGERDWAPGNENTFELETNESKNDRSDLTELFAATDMASDDTLLEDVAHILDTKSFLRYCALEALINQWDGFGYGSWGPNNYRLYHDPTTQKFTILPWGLDMTLKPGGMRKSIDPDDALGYFLKRCVLAPSCKAAFHAEIAEVAKIFDELKIDEKTAEIWLQVADAIMRDERKESSLKSIQGGIEGIALFGKNREAEILQQIAD